MALSTYRNKFSTHLSANRLKNLRRLWKRTGKLNAVERRTGESCDSLTTPVTPCILLVEYCLFHTTFKIERHRLQKEENIFTEHS